MVKRVDSWCYALNFVSFVYEVENGVELQFKFFRNFFLKESIKKEKSLAQVFSLKRS
jgi:hypothetical protein